MPKKSKDALLKSYKTKCLGKPSENDIHFTKKTAPTIIVKVYRNGWTKALCAFQHKSRGNVGLCNCMQLEVDDITEFQLLELCIFESYN